MKKKAFVKVNRGNSLFVLSLPSEPGMCRPMKMATLCACSKLGDA